MSEIQGYVDHIIYKNENNGYCVLVMVVEDKDTTVTGTFQGIEEGAMLLVRGEMIQHPVYGNQFKASSYEVKEPEDVVAIERYLASGSIKGIGAAMAKRIVKAFGEDSFRVMEEEPERLAEIKGISMRIAESIGEQMREKRGMRRVMIYLQELGISTNMAVKIYNYYEMRVFDVIKENPYQLVEDIQGIGFRTADEIASRAGIMPDSVYRIQSGILYSLNQAIGEGNTYLTEEALVTRAIALLECSEVVVKLQLENLIMTGKLISKNEEGEERIFSSLCYYTELSCARRLIDMNMHGMGDREKIESAVLKIEKSEKIVLDDIQREAVIMAAMHGISVITGGPGTGKTTIIKVLLAYFDITGQDVLLAAPTGRAAKRMSEATGYEARTIHRMLEIGIGGGMEYGKNEDDPLEADVVIVDEMSMVDVFLYHSLLKAIVPGTRFIMVGDVSQLPSVGPGAVLKDVIQSGIFHVATLEHIFRQAAKSDIVVNAHRINKGEQIKLDNKSEDFFFLERDDVNVIIDSIVYLVTSKIPGYVDARPFEIQVMTPMRKGALGVENLNKVLQERLNPPSPGKEEIISGDFLLREGDKVMQIKNNYQLEWEINNKRGICIDSGLGVFNGDIGYVKSINKAAGMVVIVFDDNREVVYQTSGLEELELSYAITIHKSQGSEYPAIVMPILTGPAMLMNRNLLYTAVTRAKKCVMIIGSSNSIKGMIENKSEMKRNSGLKERLLEINASI